MAKHRPICLQCIYIYGKRDTSTTENNNKHPHDFRYIYIRWRQRGSFRACSWSGLGDREHRSGCWNRCCDWMQLQCEDAWLCGLPLRQQMPEVDKWGQDGINRTWWASFPPHKSTLWVSQCGLACVSLGQSLVSLFLRLSAPHLFPSLNLSILLSLSVSHSASIPVSFAVLISCPTFHHMSPILTCSTRVHVEESRPTTMQPDGSRSASMSVSSMNAGPVMSCWQIKRYTCLYRVMWDRKAKRRKPRQVLNQRRASKGSEGEIDEPNQEWKKEKWVQRLSYLSECHIFGAFTSREHESCSKHRAEVCEGNAPPWCLERPEDEIYARTELLIEDLDWHLDDLK